MTYEADFEVEVDSGECDSLALVADCRGLFAVVPRSELELVVLFKEAAVVLGTVFSLFSDKESSATPATTRVVMITN